ncbi:DUF5786 family protein [Haladaptatus sp. NG-SE-30]
MGFGSYDESEQQNREQDSNMDESSAVNVHENTHDGDIEFDSGASSDELIGRLSEMRDDETDDES